MKRLILFTALLGLALPAAAQATQLVVTAEYVGTRPVPNPQQFQAIIGYPQQCVRGIPCWQYAKGTRSPVQTYPESWYLHVGPRRVTDTQRPQFYVMNPLSGWAEHVAQACAAQCFIDGMGPAGYARMHPHPAFGVQEWQQQVTQVIAAVVHAGKRALPNSMATTKPAAMLFLAAAGQASTEGFNPQNASIVTWGHVWVTERGACLAKYHAYTRYAGPGDEFSCYEPPRLPWDYSWLR